MEYYNEPTADVLRQLVTGEEGLTSAEAARRLARYGKNIWGRFSGSSRPQEAPCSRRNCGLFHTFGSPLFCNTFRQSASLDLQITDFSFVRRLNQKSGGPVDARWQVTAVLGAPSGGLDSFQQKTAHASLDQDCMCVICLMWFQGRYMIRYKKTMGHRFFFFTLVELSDKNPGIDLWLHLHRNVTPTGDSFLP